MSYDAERIFVPVASVIITAIMVGVSLLLARKEARESRTRDAHVADTEAQVMPRAS